MRCRPLLALCFAMAVTAAPAGLAAAAPQLFGTVGPGFSITLQDSGGSLVSKVDPGTYEIVVRDLSDEHNFRLFGPGVEEATGVETTGTVTWTVTFQNARYTLLCDPHSTTMIRTFVSGTPPAAPPKPPAAKPTKLLATVRAGEHDLVARRERSSAEDAQSRPLCDHRARPLEAAQLPSRRQGG